MKISKALACGLLALTPLAYGKNKGGGGGGVVVTKDKDQPIYQTLEKFNEESSLDPSAQSPLSRELNQAIRFLVEEIEGLGLSTQVETDLKEAIYSSPRRRYIYVSAKDLDKDYSLQVLRNQSTFIHRICSLDYGMSNQEQITLAAYTKDTKTYLYESFFKLGDSQGPREERIQMASILFLEALRYLFPIEFSTCFLEKKQMEFEKSLRVPNTKIKTSIEALWPYSKEEEARKKISKDLGLDHNLKMSSLTKHVYFGKEPFLDHLYFDQETKTVKVREVYPSRDFGGKDLLKLLPKSSFFRSFYSFFPKGFRIVGSSTYKNEATIKYQKISGSSRTDLDRLRDYFLNAKILWSDLSVQYQGRSIVCGFGLELPKSKQFSVEEGSSFQLLTDNCELFSSSIRLEESKYKKDHLLIHLLKTLHKDIVNWQYTFNSNCHPFDYEADGNLRSLICKLDNFKIYETMIGPYFLKSPPGYRGERSPLHLHSKTSFNYYFLPTLERAIPYFWTALSVLPKELLQDFYNRFVLKQVRGLYAAKSFMDQASGVTNDIEAYQATMKANRHYTNSNAGLHSGFLDFAKTTELWGYYPKIYYYYWLRRTIDGSSNLLSQFVSDLVQEFDSRFKRCIENSDKEQWGRCY